MLLSGLISDIIKNILYDPLLLLKFSDSDFASEKIINISIYGYLFIIARGLISWKSKRSSILTLLIMEAESDALTKAIRKT